MTKTHSYVRAVVLLYSLALAAYIAYSNRLFFHDDAYITLRYARNLLDGNGVVWNTGEHVQGYTNFLHLMIVATLGLLGMDLFWAARVIGAIALAGLVVVLYYSCRSMRATRQDAIWYFPAVIALTSAPMLVWALGGLETVLFSLLVAAGCVSFLRGISDGPGQNVHLVVSGTCLGLCALTRPDGLIFICVSIFWLAVTIKRNLRSRLLALALPSAMVILPYLIWEWSYYGGIVPNTFYVKADSGIETIKMGTAYITAYAMRPPYLPLALLAAVAWVSVVRKWNGALIYLALSVIGYMAFVCYAGGDHMPAFRMIVPVIPLMGYMFYRSLSLVTPAGSRVVHVAVAALLLGLSTAQLRSSALNPRQEDPAAHNGTIVGKYIADAWPSGSLVALSTAGSTPYYAADHRYIDMLGLNDAHIARRHVKKKVLPWQRIPGHSKGDGAYVLSRSPDYIIVGPSQGTPIANPWFLSDLEMSGMPEFYRDYEMHQVHLDSQGHPIMKGGLRFTYYKRRFARRMDRGG